MPFNWRMNWRMKNRPPGANPHPGGSADNYHGSINANLVGGQHGTVIVNNASKESVFDILRPAIASDALYCSSKREEEHVSTCLEETRSRIIKRIRDWADKDEDAVCWLHGSAGTGKSTIAHTIAEEYSRRGRLIATFFFSRRKGDREDINKLIPTLAYQIAQHVESAQVAVQRVLEKERTILDQRLRDQLWKLVVGPIIGIGQVDRPLIIIDGLDECNSRHRIVQLIQLLGELMDTGRFPIRWLLTSRPESEIEEAFTTHIAGGSAALWLALEDSKDDVQTYLRTKLQLVRDTFDSMKNEPPKWPSESHLRALVNLSEGLFVYASTAVEYIGDRKGSPKRKLETVLKIHKGLDPLYRQVIGEAKECEHFDTVMGSLMHLRKPLPIDELSKLLGLDVSEVLAALGGCHSILVIPTDVKQSVRPYHASLRDFLTSEERSQCLYYAPSKYHSILLIKCLENITNARANNVLPLQSACTTWLQYGSLLISGEIAGQELHSLLHDTVAQMKQINLAWLEWWLAEALVWVEPGELKSSLPSAKNIPESHEALRAKWSYVTGIVNDVDDWCKVEMSFPFGEAAFAIFGEYYSIPAYRSAIKKHVHTFFQRQPSTPLFNDTLLPQHLFSS